MTTASHTLHTTRFVTQNFLERARDFTDAVCSVSPVALRRILIACGVLFAIVYVGAAHFTLYEGGRFSDLQASISQKTFEQVRQEALLTEAFSARFIRAEKEAEDLIDVSSISYVEEQQNVALNINRVLPAN